VRIANDQGSGRFVLISASNRNRIVFSDDRDVNDWDLSRPSHVAAIGKRAGVKNSRLHDLRHTAWGRRGRTSNRRTGPAHLES
jgi:hypothetical protein